LPSCENLAPKNTGYKLGNDKRMFFVLKNNFDSRKGKHVCEKKEKNA
jgi:hypothetical protein